MPIMTLPPGMRCLGHGRRGPLGLPPGMLALASESIAEPAAPHSISKFIANHPVYKEHIARGDSPAEAMDAANLATFADHPVYQQRIAKGDSPLKAADAAEASMLRTALSRVMADRRRERSARQSQSVTKSRSAVSTGETALGRGDKTAIGHGQGPRPAEPVQSVSPGSQAATTQAAARQTEAEISPQKRFIKRLVKAGYSAESAESEAARMLAGKTPAEILNLAKWSEGIPDSYFAPSGIVGRTHDQSWHEIFQAERAANRERVFNTVHPEAARPMPHATPPRPKQGRGRYSNYAEAGFSNEPLELAGTEPVEQEPWQEYGIGGGESPIKYKFVSLHDGPGPAPADADTLFFQATPQVKIDTRERMRPRVENNLDWPHYVDFRRGEGQEGDFVGQFRYYQRGQGFQDPQSCGACNLGTRPRVSPGGHPLHGSRGLAREGL